MPKFFHVFLLIPILVLIASCTLGLVENDTLGPRYEALAWLDSNPNPYAFAGNRFTSTEDARNFVELLYECGAVEVLVTNVYDEDWRIEMEGGSYADTLIIHLPSEKEQRKKLFQIANEEAVGEGFSPEMDVGQDELLLWWD